MQSTWVLKNIDTGEEIRLDRPINQAGRNISSQIVCRSSTVSRNHAEFVILSDGTLRVQDFNSSNGTYVNSQRIPERTLVELKHGDEVGLGLWSTGNYKSMQPPPYYIFNVIDSKQPQIEVIDLIEILDSDDTLTTEENENVEVPKVEIKEEEIEIVEHPLPPVKIENEPEPDPEPKPKIKQEFTSNDFSAQDVSILLSDDDDEEFLCSQLFKVEDKNEKANNEEIANNMFTSIKEELKEMDKLSGTPDPIPVEDDWDNIDNQQLHNILEGNEAELDQQLQDELNMISYHDFNDEFMFSPQKEQNLNKNNKEDANEKTNSKELEIINLDCNDNDDIQKEPSPNKNKEDEKTEKTNSKELQINNHDFNDEFMFNAQKEPSPNSNKDDAYCKEVELNKEFDELLWSTENDKEITPNKAALKTKTKAKSNYVIPPIISPHIEVKKKTRSSGKTAAAAAAAVAVAVASSSASTSANQAVNQDVKKKTKRKNESKGEVVPQKKSRGSDIRTEILKTGKIATKISKKRSSCSSKEEQQNIKEKRSEKLKDIALKEAKQTAPKESTAKPKVVAKVSGGRGSFLLEEPVCSTKESTTKKRRSKSLSTEETDTTTNKTSPPIKEKKNKLEKEESVEKRRTRSKSTDGHRKSKEIRTSASKINNDKIGTNKDKKSITTLETNKKAKETDITTLNGFQMKTNATYLRSSDTKLVEDKKAKDTNVATLLNDFQMKTNATYLKSFDAKPVENSLDKKAKPKENNIEILNGFQMKTNATYLRSADSVSKLCENSSDLFRKPSASLCKSTRSFNNKLKTAELPSKEQQNASKDPRLRSASTSSIDNCDKENKLSHNKIANVKSDRIPKIKQNDYVPVPAPQINNMDVILTILNWSTSWLEEQRSIKSSPPVSGVEPVPMKQSFDSYDDYYRTVAPLLTLELWYSIYKDYDNCSQKNFKEMSITAVIEGIQKNHDKTITLCCIYFTGRNSDNNLKEEDLLLIQVPIVEAHNSRISFLKVFGYVSQRNRIFIPSKSKDRNANFKVIVNIRIKNIKGEICSGKHCYIRYISSLTSPMRIFKSAKHLKYSPLCKLVLKPTIQDFKVSAIQKYKIVAKEKLNSKQMQAVIEATDICLRNSPGMYLIQGPPGTGKSTVITSIVQEILYGRGVNSNMCILLVAPSNAAVDELTMRLVHKVKPMLSPDKKRNLKVVRIGPRQVINSEVAQYSLHSIVVRNIILMKKHAPQYATMMSAMEEVKLEIENRKRKGEPTVDCYAKMHELMSRVEDEIKKEMGHQYNNLYKQKEAILLRGANVICTTLSSCIRLALEDLYNSFPQKQTCCIIDEATQSNEQETLIPLILGINKLVLVGDPQQLPATTLSQTAKKLGYGSSLFSRIQYHLDKEKDNPINVLSTQYRMHPDIASYPNSAFYKSILKNADTFKMKKELSSLVPYVVFNMSSMNLNSDQYINKYEVDCVAKIIMAIQTIVDGPGPHSVGVITPYNVQKEEIKRRLSQEIISPVLSIYVNTVDSFQGQEKDIIIISCVRYDSNSFVADDRRLNVAITRAKYGLYIVGSNNLFNTCMVLGKLSDDAKGRNALYNVLPSHLKDTYVQLLTKKDS